MRQPVDLTDAQWAIRESLGPLPQPDGRPPAHADRERINAMRSVLRGGIAWRARPHDLPPWQTGYHSVRLWRLDGTWEHSNAARRERVRRQAGRDPAPRAAIIDSQSVKTTENWIQGGAG
jgi:putative transposase